LKQNKINKEMPYYLYIYNIYLYQYHDTKPNPINIDWLIGLTPTVGNLKLDEEGVALDRKAHTAEQKKLYKKHHMIRGILVAAFPHKEYLKMSDKSTAKAMFTSLCSNYEGNKKVREAKATMLVHQYELFRMKEDESIETMYSRF